MFAAVSEAALGCANGSALKETFDCVLLLIGSSEPDRATPVSDLILDSQVLVSPFYR